MMYFTSFYTYFIVFTCQNNELTRLLCQSEILDSVCYRGSD